VTLEPGQQLLHYRLVEKIGQGGMGVVWKAVDTSLDREVAIKVLPALFADDPDRLARFEREAKMLASLHHPHVASVFGVHDANGVRFLAMELVPGEDLSLRLQRSSLTIAEAIDVARQVALALEAAHERGVIHRDLKPANVKLATDGTVKILDFGLAKAAALEATPDSDPSSSPTMTSAGSVPGVILGTAAYMSPEQARGQLVDKRSDIWSFGCVLWECLAGEALFGRETASDSIGAILHTEPDWGRLPENTPPGVRHLLRRCLAKDPRKRLHHVADARIELEDLEEVEVPDSGKLMPGVQRSLKNYKAAVAALAIALVAVLIASIVFVSRQESSGSDRSTSTLRNPLVNASLTRITDFQGAESHAAISRDGRFVAFLSDHEGQFDVWRGQITAGDFHNLTRGELGDLRPPGWGLGALGFSAEGSEIWLTGAPDRRMRAIPLLGGPPRNVLGPTVINADWSPDGERVVYHTRDEGDPLFIADRNGENSREVLRSAPGVHQHFPTWSPDGKWIYLTIGRESTGEVDLWRLRPDGTDREQLTEDKRYVVYPTPIDARTVIFCAQEENGAGPWLWAVDVETKRTRRLSIGVERYTSVSASAEGSRLVASVADSQSELWSIPILDRVATESDAAPLELPTVRAQAPRFGAETLFYLASRGSGDGLWRFRAGEATEIWKGTETPLLEPAAVSRDGKSVAVVLRRKGLLTLHVISEDGAELRSLSETVDVRGTASWSPSGQWVVAGGEESGSKGLFKLPVDGGAPQRIADGEALNPVWSPDGGLIVYAGKQLRAFSPLLAIRPDGTPVEMPSIELLTRGERARFLPDGSALIYMQGKGVAQDFWLLDLAAMESRRLTRLEGNDRIRTFDISPDGATIVFDRQRANSDIVLIELEGG
jgi:serine/threonine protein kinase/WD40 repeat protein